MRSRTITFIPDPFEPIHLPLGVLVEHAGRVVFEACPMPDDLDASMAALWRMEMDSIGEEPHAERLPDSCGPHVLLGPWHDPLVTLPRAVFEALMRATDTPYYRAELQAALDEGRRAIEGARG